jgi:acetyltransferase-like isoleucine patch superfamily enzyme
MRDVMRWETGVYDFGDGPEQAYRMAPIDATEHQGTTWCDQLTYDHVCADWPSILHGIGPHWRSPLRNAQFHSRATIAESCTIGPGLVVMDLDDARWRWNSPPYHTAITNSLLGRDCRVYGKIEGVVSGDGCTLVGMIGGDLSLTHIGSGSTAHGYVRHGVVIGENVQMRMAGVMPGTIVADGATIKYASLPCGTSIGEAARLLGSSSSQVTISNGASVPSGAIVYPGCYVYEQAYIVAFTYPQRGNLVISQGAPVGMMPMVRLTVPSLRIRNYQLDLAQPDHNISKAKPYLEIARRYMEIMKLL